MGWMGVSGRHDLKNRDQLVQCARYLDRMEIPNRVQHGHVFCMKTSIPASRSMADDEEMKGKVESGLRFTAVEKVYRLPGAWSSSQL